MSLIDNRHRQPIKTPKINYIMCAPKKQQEVFKYKINSSLYLHFKIGIVFGIMRENYSPDTFFSGLIDDVRIYNVALSEEQIAALAQ